VDYYRNKRVFITGGSSGIGKATARLLKNAGAQVWIAARGADRLEATAIELGCGWTPMDVSKVESVNAGAIAVLEGLGGLDIVINNAGIAHPATMLDTPADIFDQMMQVNYMGTVHVTRALLPHLRTQGSGHICNVASLLGFMGIYGYTAYAASKFAITGFSDCLRQELIGTGIGISVLFPADTDTPQLHEENKIKPPETKAIAGEVKTMSPETVAMAMLKGIQKGTYHIVPGAMSKFTYFMYRHAPGVVRWVIDAELKKYRRKNPTAG